MNTVGISYWTGKPDQVTELCIKHNCNYFDTFYFITDNPPVEFLSNPKICILDANKLHEWIERNYNLKLAPNFISDILTYKCSQILMEVYGIYNCSKILKLDTDYFIYNKMLIWDLFENCGNSIAVKDWSEKLIRGTGKYFNCGAVFVLYGDIKFQELVDDQLNSRLAEDMYYTEIGPRLINSTELRAYMSNNPYSEIEAHTLDKGILSIGWNKFPKVHNALGMHLTSSFLKNLGYKLVHILEDGVNLNIYIDKL